MVVKGDEQRCERAGAIKALETGSWSGMELVGPVQAFNKLLERSVPC